MWGFVQFVRDIGYPIYASGWNVASCRPGPAGICYQQSTHIPSLPVSFYLSLFLYLSLHLSLSVSSTVALSLSLYFSLCFDEYFSPSLSLSPFLRYLNLRTSGDSCLLRLLEPDLVHDLAWHLQRRHRTCLSRAPFGFTRPTTAQMRICELSKRVHRFLREIDRSRCLVFAMGPLRDMTEVVCVHLSRPLRDMTEVVCVHLSRRILSVFDVRLNIR